MITMSWPPHNPFDNVLLLQEQRWKWLQKPMAVSFHSLSTSSCVLRKTGLMVSLFFYLPFSVVHHPFPNVSR